MSYSPMLTLHILGGTVGLLSGTAAMAFRKGSPRHVLAVHRCARVASAIPPHISYEMFNIRGPSSI